MPDDRDTRDTDRGPTAPGSTVAIPAWSSGSGDLPPPSSRTLQEAEALLEDIEAGALQVFGNRGLPTQRGLYRHHEHEDGWERVPDATSPADRWDAVLERPAEEGFGYLSLADLGRHLRPQDTGVHSAATVMDRASDVRRLLQDSGEDDLQGALLMFWSVIDLMAPFASERD